MLVLTRKIDEQIKIGDDITITIIKLRNNQIRIGIDAPRDVRVLRGELEPKETPTNNRVTQFIEADADSIKLPTPTPATEARSNSETHSNSDVRSSSEVHSNVVDGLASASEMIAKGETMNEVDPESNVQIFSGKIRTQIDCTQVDRNTRNPTTAMRAPLSDFFSAT